MEMLITGIENPVAHAPSGHAPHEAVDEARATAIVAPAVAPTAMVPVMMVLTTPPRTAAPVVRAVVPAWAVPDVVIDIDVVVIEVPAVTRAIARTVQVPPISPFISPTGTITRAIDGAVAEVKIWPCDATWAGQATAGPVAGTRDAFW